MDNKIPAQLIRHERTDCHNNGLNPERACLLIHQQGQLKGDVRQEQAQA